MKPRVVPRRKGITNAALAAADLYGQMGPYRQKVDRAQTIALLYLELGLPSEFDPKDTVRGSRETTTDFWIYVEEVHGIYLGFAETVRAERLRLVALCPNDLLTLDEMIELTKGAT